MCYFILSFISFFNSFLSFYFISIHFFLSCVLSFFLSCYRINHVEEYNQATQERPSAVNLSPECVRHSCYIIKGPRPSADGIQHTHAVEPVAPRPIPAIWDFLLRNDQSEDDGY